MDGVRMGMQALRKIPEDAQDIHSGNQEFGPPNPPSGKRLRRRRSAGNYKFIINIIIIFYIAPHP